MRTITAYLVVAGAASVLLSGCSGEAEQRRYSRKKAQKSLKVLENPGVVIGEFTLAQRAVVDGDTIRVDGLDSTLRLLAMDTEETFKKPDRRRAAETNFAEYRHNMHAKRRRPGRMGTFLGEEAKQWAKKFFAGVKSVRLERDHPKQIRGRFNRYLSYVLVNKNGKWLNYNVEGVRAGMSPYYMKYGYSRRFHAEFVKAEAEAKAAKRGIWAPNAQGYGDYPARKAWWKTRADFVKKFEQDAQGRKDYISLTDWDALQRLEQHLGKEVVVLATVGKIRIGHGRRPTKVMLSRRMFNDFPLIFFDKDVFGTSNIAKYKGEFVRVRGTVNKYRNKYNGREILQIMISLPGQISGGALPGDSSNKATPPNVRTGATPNTPNTPTGATP